MLDEPPPRAPLGAGVETDAFVDLPIKYPVAWNALSQLANTSALDAVYYPINADAAQVLIDRSLAFVEMLKWRNRFRDKGLKGLAGC